MDEVYTVKDIMRILKIGKNRAYELMQSSGFPATKLGHTYFVTQDKFQKWLDKMEAFILFNKYEVSVIELEDIKHM